MCLLWRHHRNFPVFKCGQLIKEHGVIYKQTVLKEGYVLTIDVKMNTSKPVIITAIIYLFIMNIKWQQHKRDTRWVLWLLIFNNSATLNENSHNEYAIMIMIIEMKLLWSIISNYCLNGNSHPKFYYSYDCLTESIAVT